jgi:hypothetical protein
MVKRIMDHYAIIEFMIYDAFLSVNRTRMTIMERQGWYIALPCIFLIYMLDENKFDYSFSSFFLIN